MVSTLAVGPLACCMLCCLLVHASDEKGTKMTEEQFPDEEPDAVQDGMFTDQSPGAASSLEPDPVAGEPDTNPGAAENNPGTGRDKPLLQDDTVSGEEEDFLSEQTLRDETQHGTDVPTLEEAAAETDPGEAPTGNEPGPSDDQANLGGSPLSRFDPEDLDR
jgi:hypothetical protein